MCPYTCKTVAGIFTLEYSRVYLELCKECASMLAPPHTRKNCWLEKAGKAEIVARRVYGDTGSLHGLKCRLIIEPYMHTNY